MATTTLLRTTDQNSQFHRLIGLRKIDKEDKAELVRTITKGRTSSSADMTIDEMATAIEMLADEQMGSIKKMRGKIIGIYRDIINHPEPLKFEQRHWDSLNKFLMGKFKTKLHKLSYESLRNAVTAMERWRDSGTKKMVEMLTDP